MFEGPQGGLEDRRVSRLDDRFFSLRATPGTVYHVLYRVTEADGAVSSVIATASVGDWRAKYPEPVWSKHAD